LIQSLIGAVVDNAVEVGLVTVVVTATFLIYGAETLDRLRLVLVGGAVVEIIWMGVRVMVCAEQPVSPPES
jgi:hypothetical protein